MALKILIVDDSRLVPAVISQTLEMAQVEVEELHKAGNGQEGLEILRAHPVDLVFSDIHMPVMDGVAMIDAIKNDENLKEIPIIVVSSEGSQQRLDYLKNIGIKAFIQKPFTPEAISEAIELVMGD